MKCMGIPFLFKTFEKKKRLLIAAYTGDSKCAKTDNAPSAALPAPPFISLGPSLSSLMCFISPEENCKSFLSSSSPPFHFCLLSGNILRYTIRTLALNEI